MQRGRAPAMVIGGQRATILQQNSGSVQAASAATTRVVRPVSQTQQPGMPQTPVRMVKMRKCSYWYLIW